MIRCTWDVEDHHMAHPRHTYRSTPARELAEAAAWDAWRGAYKGLRLAEVHLGRCPEGPWVRILPHECADCEDTGTTELRDVSGRLLEVSYCSCARGEQIRADEDRAAEGVIEAANRNLGSVSMATLAAVLAALRKLDTASVPQAPSPRIARPGMGRVPPTA